MSSFLGGAARAPSGYEALAGGDFDDLGRAPSPLPPYLAMFVPATSSTAWSSPGLADAFVLSFVFSMTRRPRETNPSPGRARGI
jgi:hypothetical protein